MDSNLIHLQSRSYNFRRKSVGRGRDKGRLKSLGDEFGSLDANVSDYPGNISNAQKNNSLTGI